MAHISVCIPTYNGARYLADALRSVLAQTYDDFELIVCDDASTDETVKVAASFRDERLRVVINPSRLGLVGNWNRCLELTGGEYIVLFHQDDLMYPENLRQKADLLSRQPDAAFVHSDIDCIDESGRVIGGHWASQPSRSTVMAGEAFYSAVAGGVNPVACPAVMIRRACLSEVGNFNDRFPFVVDLAMWLQLAARYDVGYVAQKLIAHRLHNQQEGSRYRNTGRDALDILRLLDYTRATHLSAAHRRHIEGAYLALSRQSAGMARWQVKSGHVGPAARYLRVALLARARLAQ